MLDECHFTIICDNQAVVQRLTKKNRENFSARILRQLQYISHLRNIYRDLRNIYEKYI